MVSSFVHSESLLPRQLIPGDGQRAHRVAHRAHRHVRVRARRLHVADAATRVRLRAGEGRHAQGEGVRLGGQQDGRHELTHALGGQAGTLGLEGGGLKADESSLKVITMITRRTSVSVACTMHSQQHGSFLSSIALLPPKNQRLGMNAKWRGSRFERGCEE